MKFFSLIKLLLLTLFLNVSSTFLSAQIIFSEPFDEADGAITGNDNTGGIAWTTTCSACLAGDHFFAQSGQLEGQDTNGPAVWQTSAIDISSCTFISIDFTINSQGTMEACGTGCNSVDWVQLEYNIDGGGWQTPSNSFFCAGACADINVIQADDVIGGPINYSTGCMNGGNSIQLRITVQAWAADEFWRIDNVTLSCATGPTADAGDDVSICSGNSVTLNGVGAVGTPSWSPGTGLSSTSILNPVATPSASTNYTLTVTSGACAASDDVMVTIIPVTPISASNDITICSGDCTNLTVSGGDSFEWDPDPDITNVNDPNQAVCPTSTTTYNVTSFTVGNNLIVNGDFEAGNTGFSSSYTFTNPTNTTEGQYNIIPNPSTFNGGFSPCPDHTSGAGNMMVINGAPVAGTTIWCQTISVEANTDYLFSAWLMTLVASNPAQLQFTINGIPIGSTLDANSVTCIWDEFFTTWNSGVSTSANICIINLNTSVAGNDFALDDISFSSVCEQTESVTVTVTSSPTITAENDLTFCEDENVPLNTFTSVPAGATINWTNSNTAIGLGASGTGNLPTFTATNTTSSPIVSTITATPTAGSCTGPDEVFTITINPLPTVGAGSDQTICEGTAITLTATNPDAAIISWDGGVTNGVSFTPPVGTNTYTVTATNATTLCESQDDVIITVTPAPNVVVNAAGPFNTTSPATNITASPAGGTWTASCGACINATTGLFDPAVAGEGTWQVCYTAGVAPCDDSECIDVLVSNNCLMTGSLVSNDPTCFQFNDGSVTANVLNANGTPDYVITNSGGTVLNIGNTNAANNLSEGWYYVSVTDDLGCTYMDSVELFSPAEIQVVLNVTQPTCYNLANGIAIADTVVNYQGSYNQISYFWTPNPNANNGIGADTVNNLFEGSYNLIINDENGCSISIDFEITYPDSLYFVELGVEPAYCRLFSYQSGNGVVFASASGGTPDYDYEWTNLQTGVSVNNTTWGGLNPGQYQIEVIDENGCVLISTVEVDSLNPIADFDLTSPQFTALYEGNAVVDVHYVNQSLYYANPNDPNADTTFFWHFGFTGEPWILSEDVNETFDISYAVSGEYEICLVALNKNGCSDTSCVFINIYDPFTFTPVNIFTPNGDGANDFFTFDDKSSSIEIFHCVIVDRWGVTIYEMNAITDSWNGLDSKGNVCPNGVYFYTYEASSFNGIETSGQGTIQLIGE